MALLGAWRKRLAIRSYARSLPRLLRRDYGPSVSYTPAQVRNTIERYRLSVTYECYAISMFSSRHDFQHYHTIIGRNCDYDMMRAEVASSHLHGMGDFASQGLVQDVSGDGHDGGSLHDHISGSSN